MYKQVVTHEPSCCFAYKTHCFFYVLVNVRVVGSGGTFLKIQGRDGKDNVA